MVKPGTGLFFNDNGSCLISIAGDATGHEKPGAKRLPLFRVTDIFSGEFDKSFLTQAFSGDASFNGESFFLPVSVHPSRCNSFVLPAAYPLKPGEIMEQLRWELKMIFPYKNDGQEIIKIVKNNSGDSLLISTVHSRFYKSIRSLFDFEFELLIEPSWFSVDRVVRKLYPEARSMACFHLTGNKVAAIYYSGNELFSFEIKEIRVPNDLIELMIDFASANNPSKVFFFSESSTKTFISLLQSKSGLTFENLFDRLKSNDIKIFNPGLPVFSGIAALGAALHNF